MGRERTKHSLAAIVGAVVVMTLTGCVQITKVYPNGEPEKKTTLEKAAEKVGEK